MTRAPLEQAVSEQRIGNSGLVPVLDLAALRSSDRARRQRELGALDEACRSVGFFQVVDHGVAPSTIAAVLAAMDAFFAQRIPEKLVCRPPRATVNRGYAPVGSESLSYSLGMDAPPDLFEAFNIGPDAVPDLPIYCSADESCFAPNIWPESLPRFREAVNGYFDAIAALAHQLSAACALALGLEEDFFESRTDHSTDMLRMNHYSLSAGSLPLAGQFGMGPHTDYGILTILYADPVRGLQIMSPDGGWTDVLPAPGALLVNLGDLLAQWTNDRWQSTVHRVLPPERHDAEVVRRRSIAFFHDGNYDAVVECLPTCRSQAVPPKYAPVVAGEHLRAKLLGPRTMTPSTAASTLGERQIDSSS